MNNASSAPLLKTWTFKSSSNPNKAYETQLHSDNTTSCNCRGWCIARGEFRTCKHTRWVEEGVADRYADGVWENPATTRAREQAAAVPVKHETKAKKAKVEAKEFVAPARRVVNWR